MKPASAARLYSRPCFHVVKHYDMLFLFLPLFVPFPLFLRPKTSRTVTVANKYIPREYASSLTEFLLK